MSALSVTQLTLHLDGYGQRLLSELQTAGETAVNHFFNELYRRAEKELNFRVGPISVAVIAAYRWAAAEGIFPFITRAAATMSSNAYTAIAAAGAAVAIIGSDVSAAHFLGESRRYNEKNRSKWLKWVREYTSQYREAVRQGTRDFAETHSRTHPETMDTRYLTDLERRFREYLETPGQRYVYIWVWNRLVRWWNLYLYHSHHRPQGFGITLRIKCNRNDFAAALPSDGDSDARRELYQWIYPQSGLSPQVTGRPIMGPSARRNYERLRRLYSE